MDLQPNDSVEILQADKKHDCVYVGQRGRVISVQHGQVSLHLRCGHLWDLPLSHVRKLEPEEVVAAPIHEAPVEELGEDAVDDVDDVSEDE